MDIPLSARVETLHSRQHPVRALTASVFAPEGILITPVINYNGSVRVSFEFHTLKAEKAKFIVVVLLNAQDEIFRSENIRFGFLVIGCHSYRNSPAFQEFDSGDIHARFPEWNDNALIFPSVSHLNPARAVIRGRNIRGGEDADSVH